ncbi:MAG: siroheme decarboxylase subunit beta [Gammaproteobacteria bacterium]
MIDLIDQQIIRATQTGLPLTPRPYRQIAELLGLSEQDVIERMAAMQANGIIRRIGAVPNHYRLGYRYNGMTVWDVPDEHVDRLGREVGLLPFVSHCYRRPRHFPEWPYNLFAMVHAKNQDDADELIKQIAAILGNCNHGYEVLYSSRILKKTGLRIGV